MVTMSAVFRRLGTVPTWKSLLALLLLTATGLSVRGYVQERGRRLQDAAVIDTLQRINDSTQARLATTQRDREALASMLAAERALKGRLVAGVRFRIKPETVTVATPVPVHTEVLSDSASRVATVRDTVRGTVVNIDVLAPPYPESLRIGYSIVSPPIEPVVGFVRRGQHTYAVVSVAGRETEVLAPYVAPSPTRFPLTSFAGARVALRQRGDDWAEVYGGLETPVPFASKWKARVTLGYSGTRTWGVALERRVF